MILNKEIVLAIYKDISDTFTLPQESQSSAKRVDEKTKNNLIDDVAAGLTKAQATKKYGLSLSTVCRYVRECNKKSAA